MYLLWTKAAGALEMVSGDVGPIVIQMKMSQEVIIPRELRCEYNIAMGSDGSLQKYEMKTESVDARTLSLMDGRSWLRVFRWW